MAFNRAAGARNLSPVKSPRFGRISLPTTCLAVGMLLIAASFLPVGSWVAQSQWTRDDSAAFARVGSEYKRFTLESPARRGLSQAERDAQVAKMEQRMQALQAKLDRAKSQPKRWSRYLLGCGVVFIAVGFFGGSSRES